MSKFPILYKGDATDFFTLGLGPIQMLKATVTQERNGIFIFEGEILTNSPLFPLVLENYIIKADADYLLKDQRFRIKRIVPNHNGKAEIYAEHVSYLSRELTIKPEVSITGSAQIALSQWKASIVEANPFVVDSDIPTSNKTKWRIDKVENPRIALGGVEGSILDIWGGEYRFDNYHISLLQKRGTTAKTVLAYGRNITDFEQERNIANTYTSIAPYAIYTDGKENEVVVHVDGYVVDSQHVNKYPNRVTLPVDFSSEFGHDEIPTKARLLALANQYIKANEIGVPSTSIKVSFVDLSKSSDYAEYAFLEQVNLCDDVRVYYPKLGVNTVAKVIRTVWNVLTESYDEIEIGQKRMSLVGQMQEQQQAIKEINTQTNFAMTSADGKNTIFHGLYGENGLGEPTAIKVGDTWFKPNGTGTDILTWTGTVWQLVFDAKTFDDIGVKVDEMEQDIIDATEKAQSGLDKAEEAITQAGFLNDVVDIAVEQSADAVSQAQQAMSDAANALDAYKNMEIGGRNLIKDSSIPFELIGTGSYVYKIIYIGLKRNTTYTFSSKVTFLEGSSDVITVYPYLSAGNSMPHMHVPIIDGKIVITFTTDNRFDYNLLVYSGRSGQTSGNQVLFEEYQLEKGNKATDWSPAPEDVQVQITDINGELSRKVSQQTFDLLEGTVNTQRTLINQNTEQIGFKANKDYVDTINNQVESVQSELTIQAGEILGLSSKTDGLVTEFGQMQSSFDTFRITLGEVQTGLNGAVKETVVEYYLSTSLTTATGGSWVTTAPPWTAGKYMWSRTKITYVNGATSYTPATCIAGAQGQQGTQGTPGTPGQKGEQGVQGNTGATGKSVSSIIPQYAMTTSKITAPTRGWTTTAPTWIEGQYIWTRSQINWTNPTSTTYTTPVVDSALDAVATKYSDLQIKVDGIQSTVSRIDGDYATNTKVNQLADQWTQTTNLANGHTGQISNLGSQINFRLTQKQVLDEISKDKEVIDTRNTNERPQWYWDNYPRTVVKELKICAVMGLPAEAGEFATVVTDTSWSRYGVGAITQTAIVNSGQYQRKSTSGTVWDYWAKIADTSNVLAQINLSTEGIMIQGKKIQITGETYIQNAVIKTAHIADLAITDAKIANASISSAKIISLDASKITANTLSAITTNTGDLNISGNLTLSTANSIISGSYDFKEDVGEAYNPRKFIGTSELVQRYMVFKGGIYTPTNTHLGYAETYFGLDFFKMRWYNSQSEKQLRGRIDMNHGQIEFGDTFGRPHTVIGSEEIYFGRGLSTNRIYATADWPSFLINEHNTNGIMGIRLTNNNYGFGTFSKDNNLASINVGGDGKPRVWFERGVYDRTYSASANMFVTEAGTIGRAVSARKYKTDINKEKLENAKDILKIQPSSWLDKVEVSKGKIKQRYYGFIADEFHAIGLTEVVQYGIYGDVEGLDYDHISMYHNVILSDHEKEIIDLKQKVSELEKQVRVLQMTS